MPNENRTARNIAAGLFIAGAILTGFILEIARGFGRAQAGMSAGTVPGAPSRDATVIPLLCSYFAVSAFGVLTTNEQRTLRKFAVVAHLLAFIAYGIICSEARPGKILSSVLTLAVIMVVYFLPWVVVWLVVLAKAASPTENPPLENKVSPP